MPLEPQHDSHTRRAVLHKSHTLVRGCQSQITNSSFAWRNHIGHINIAVTEAVQIKDDTQQRFESEAKIRLDCTRCIFQADRMHPSGGIRCHPLNFKMRTSLYNGSHDTNKLRTRSAVMNTAIVNLRANKDIILHQSRFYSCRLLSIMPINYISHLIGRT